MFIVNSCILALGKKEISWPKHFLLFRNIIIQFSVSYSVMPSILSSDDAVWVTR
jgi:hypothetical protein